MAATTALPTAEDPRLHAMVQADRVWNGVTTAWDGRVFVGFPQADRPGVQVEELVSGRDPVPIPDAAWNAGATGGDVSLAFVLIILCASDPTERCGSSMPAHPGSARPRSSTSLRA